MRAARIAPVILPIACVLAILLGCGAFALYPRRWSPDLAEGVLAGTAMYFVAFTRAAARSGFFGAGVEIGPGAAWRVVGGFLYRAAVFLLILTALAFVYFDRRSFLDITWPLLILTSWSLADSTLRSRKGA
jgi:hypothetical protein